MIPRRHTSKKPSKKKWADHYTHKARQEGYPARSAYKLQALDNKFNLMRPGHTVLDLGCAPGAWLLYVAKQVTSSGQVWGIDLKPVTITLPNHVTVVEADIFKLDAHFWAEVSRPFDLILSDMAPATTGSKNTDAARSVALCEAALFLARERLIKGGSAAFKIFQGAGCNSFRDTMREMFAKLDLFKPPGSRKASKEMYLVGRGLTV